MTSFYRKFDRLEFTHWIGQAGIGCHGNQNETVFFYSPENSFFSLFYAWFEKTHPVTISTPLGLLIETRKSAFEKRIPSAYSKSTHTPYQT